MALSSVVSIVPNYYLVTLLNSNLLFDYYREYVNCTVNVQINDIRQLPIIIPNDSELENVQSLFSQAYSIKKENPDSTPEVLIVVEEQMDKVVNALYSI